MRGVNTGFVAYALAKVLLAALFVFVLAGAFLYLPPAQAFRNESLARLIVLHVPNPIVAAIASALSAWFALRYLIARRWIDDVRSRSLASIAMLFWLLTTVTGAVFAKVEWGPLLELGPQTIVDLHPAAALPSLFRAPLGDRRPE